MEPDSDRLIIEGVQEDGRRFRPSDWAERISANLARFGPDHRLHYADSVRPCLIGGVRCLVVEQDLYLKDPQSFNFILDFAKSNHLRIQPDRRRRPREEQDQREGENGNG
ncbi:DUF3579 domain-containing protein [Ectothiorhodospiraceae bacterium 2226]|nr:DUF3579 domain-containing protein [Ectothiorhodospiraceae bacterium 2226]